MLFATETVFSDQFGMINAIVNHELPLIFTKVLHFNLCSFVLICGFICVYCTVQMRRAHHK
jgi:hypothetical protein